MILLDKITSGNTINVSVQNSISDTGITGFTMNLSCDWDNVYIADIELTETSLYTSRYNEFSFDNDILVDLKPGLYTYTIVNNNKIVATDILKIIDTTPVTLPFTYNDNDDKEFFTY